MLSRLTTKSRIPEYQLCTKREPAGSARYGQYYKPQQDLVQLFGYTTHESGFPQNIIIHGPNEGYITLLSIVVSSPTETRN